MAEENKEVVEQTTGQPVEDTKQSTDQPRNEKGQFKAKFDSEGDDSVIKVDLNNPPPPKSEEVEKEPAKEEKVDVVKEPETKEEVVEETIEQPVLQEITEEEIEKVEEEIEEAVTEAEETGQPLPENIQKLINFMEETKEQSKIDH